jgi:hypothetical protein
VALGAAVTAGLAAFALIPTKDLRVVKPSKPMFFYITQLLQAQVITGLLWQPWPCLCSSVFMYQQLGPQSALMVLHRSFAAATLSSACPPPRGGLHVL